MRLSELSHGGALWIIPGERTKNHLEHEVPLAALAREILEEVVPLPRGTRETSNSINTVADLVFTTTGTTPISGWSKIKKRLDEEMLAEARRAASAAGRDPSDVKIAPWRLHDLRRTCATGMAEIGILPHIVEACLNHISGAKAGVAGIYNRAEYKEEKKAALERWAAHVEWMISGRAANVVPMHRAG
jgi:integrase